MLSTSEYKLTGARAVAPPVWSSAVTRGCDPYHLIVALYAATRTVLVILSVMFFVIFHRLPLYVPILKMFHYLS